MIHLLKIHPILLSVGYLFLLITLLAIVMVILGSINDPANMVRNRRKWPKA